jgi:hypothetical protein
VAEQDARVLGATGLLSLQPMYRVYSRRTSANAAVILALLGSASHQTPQSVSAITAFFLTFSVGFIRPPELCQMQASMPCSGCVWHLPIQQNCLQRARNRPCAAFAGSRRPALSWLHLQKHV